MFKYIVKRLALAVLILLGVSMIIYFLIRLMPETVYPSLSAAAVMLPLSTRSAKCVRKSC